MATPPEWLSAALVPQSPTAQTLVGHYIVYRWPVRLGGWLVGKVTEVNKDTGKKVGETVCNFGVYYEADKETAHHHLDLHRYARSAKAAVDFWALLGEL